MPLLPYDTLVIESPLPVDQARARLQQATGRRRMFRLGRSTHPFVGEVTEGEVRIERAIGYENSFLPRIRGRLEPRAGGCRLRGTLSLHPLTLVFMILWLGGALLIGIPVVRAQPSAGKFAAPVWLIPGMLAFGWILCSGAFSWEARIARNRLAALLDAAPSAGPGR